MVWQPEIGVILFRKGQMIFFFFDSKMPETVAFVPIGVVVQPSNLVDKEA